MNIYSIFTKLPNMTLKLYLNVLLIYLMHYSTKNVILLHDIDKITINVTFK